MSGVGIIIPMEIAEVEVENSCKLTKSIQDHIILQDPIYTPATENNLKYEIKRAKQSRNQRILDEITLCVTDEMRLCLEIAQGNGALQIGLHLCQYRRKVFISIKGSSGIQYPFDIIGLFLFCQQLVYVVNRSTCRTLVRRVDL